MTQNQLQYQYNKEAERHNAAVEMENQRNNKFNNAISVVGAGVQVVGAVTSILTGGANIIGTLGGLAVNAARAGETVRHNQALETETKRANEMQERLKADQTQKQYTIGLGQLDLQREQLDVQRRWNEMQYGLRSRELQLTEWYQREQIGVQRDKLDIEQQRADDQRWKFEQDTILGQQRVDQGSKSLDIQRDTLSLREQVDTGALEVQRRRADTEQQRVEAQYNPYWRGLDMLVRYYSSRKD